ncbi:MAG TPA: NAD(P)-binding domain-containing protein, partial [Solirubrobacterales bacterium]|nr:NAD(P)-binding domain-containing protein [Solirubrobacterales bacterium]
MRIGIVGVGYVGLPLAVAFAEEGLDVVCFDPDEKRMTALAEGRSYVEDVPDATLAALGERLRPTTVAESLRECGAIIVCVPTPLTNSREPDLSYLTEA